MTKSETASRRIDVLAIGLFGLAVGALTVGMAQVGQIPEMDKVGVLVIALVFGGLVQVLAGVADIRYNESWEGQPSRCMASFGLQCLYRSSLV